MLESRGIEQLYKKMDINEMEIANHNYERVVNDLSNRNYLVTEAVTKLISSNRGNTKLNEILVDTDCGVKHIYIRKNKQKLGTGYTPISIPVTKHYDFIIIDDGHDFWIIPDLFIHSRETKSNYISLGKRHDFYKNNWAILDMKKAEMLAGMVRL